MTLTALIADDEPLARSLVREYLLPHREIDVIAEADNGLEAVRQILDRAPDLIFLDIQMPKLSGLEVLQITGVRRGVVFTTAYDQHALAAFDLHAVDYLLKPFSQDRFDAAIRRAAQLLRDDAPAVGRLLAAQPLRRVLIREGAELHILPLDEVDYIEAQGDYVAFHHAGRNPGRVRPADEQRADHLFQRRAMRRLLPRGLHGAERTGDTRAVDGTEADPDRGLSIGDKNDHLRTIPIPRVLLKG